MNPPALHPEISEIAADKPQHLKALEKANMVRQARADLKRAIRRGDAHAGEVIRTCPWESETMTLAELLRSQRSWGRTRTRKFLLPLALSENKPLGSLTERQRRMIAGELAARAERSAERHAGRSKPARSAESRV